MFRFRTEGYRIRLPPDQNFFNRKKATHAEDGFFRDGKQNRRWRIMLMKNEWYWLLQACLNKLLKTFLKLENLNDFALI